MSIGAQALAKWGPPTDKPHGLWEYVEGVWKEVPRMGAFASLIAFVLGRKLGNFVEEQGLGLTMTETLFRLHPDGPARRPDLAFIKYDRWPYPEGLTEDLPAFDVAPNLAVEVNSPTNTFEEILDKVHDYFFHGVELVWIVMPRHRLVYIYDSPEDVRILSAARELDGGRVLPGFRLPLDRLFKATVKPS